MKNLSIRTKILATLVLVNLLGAVAVVVYLHQSYSASLDVIAEKSVDLGVGSWEQLTAGSKVDPVADPAAVADVLARMKEITGADYGLMLDKAVTDPDAYAAGRDKAGLPNNWDEGDAYAMVAATDDAAAERMRFEATPDTIPEFGRIVGIENGACTKTCHDNVREEGAYWAVTWSNDSNSRTHAVFPIIAEDGRAIGAVYAIEDITAEADGAETALMRTLLVIGMTLLVATLILGAVVDTLLFKRLNRMVEAVHDLSLRVAGGDFDARFEPDGSNDEIGKFEQFFANLIDVMTGTLKAQSNKDRAAS